MVRRQRAVWRVAATVAIAAGSVVSWPSTAIAAGTFSSPLSAVAGETITVSTTSPCLDLFSPDPFFAQIALSETGAGNPPLAVVNLAPGPDGTWSGPLTIPSNLGPGAYDLEAFCVYLTGGFEIPDEIVIDRGVAGPTLPPGTVFGIVPYDLNVLTITTPLSDPATGSLSAAPAVLAAPTITG